MLFSGLSVMCSPSVVTEGQRAAVICNFGAVMAAHSFVILHYSLTNTGVPDFPLVCLRTAGGLECEVHDGYEYDIIVNNFTAILRLPRVSSEDLGTYTCTSVTSNSAHASCTLTFSEGSEESGSFFLQHKVFISGGVGAIIATAVTVAVCIFIMYRKGHARYQYPQRRPESDSDPYKTLPAVGYEKTGNEEDTSSYAEVRDSPPSQRTTRPETKLLTRQSGMDATPPGIEKDTMNTSLKVELVSLSELPTTCRLPEHRGPQTSDLADLPENLVRHDSLTPGRGEKNILTHTLGNNEGGYLKPRDRSSNDQAPLCTQDETFPRLSGITGCRQKTESTPAATRSSGGRYSAWSRKEPVITVPTFFRSPHGPGPGELLASRSVPGLLASCRRRGVYPLARQLPPVTWSVT
ncbi:uncharacterized protein LOC112569521 [Pomacea canaliculata]|uniref:uncharacterized protein LOC112569521 n=1 Tax=Pomacea canaliculata TaxID=400727 RepID=UPI000D72F562|nr:uncharacterized protein LOC112569521 [Pomacea canaliculata]